ncbi:MAG: tellurite resistance protein TerC [Actinomycetota bacterium]|jgi:tellurite resistance protein TerC|nr:tellurite resistance protein TerC [Actinomycetota bacterium]
MDVPTWLWLTTVGLMAGLLAVDVFVIGRRPHEPSLRESAVAIAFYIALAMLFGAGVWLFAGGRYAGEYYAGWLTEYSLSIDNLFVFVIIMARFAVPRQLQQTALLIGIILALVMRGIFIALGAAAIAEFSWVFYLFGAFLVYTAVKLAAQGHAGSEDFTEPRLLRLVRSRLPATGDYHSVKLMTRVDGTRLITPMFIVIVALGLTDLLFALDSIPAIYGLTKEPYLVFAANVFALMGLRQLYFLIGGLLQRLVYLSLGLSVVLGFIGVKLVLEALHTNELPFVNGGQPVGVPTIPIWISLAAILGTLAVTTAASIVKVRRDPAQPRSDG